MNTFAKLGFISLLFFTVYVRKAQGIGCYVCDSLDDPGCESNPPSSSYKRECHMKDGQLYDRCRKVFQWLDTTAPGEPKGRTIRSCSWAQRASLEEMDDPCHEEQIMRGHQEICTCKTSYCNGATTTFVSVLTLAVPLIFLSYFTLSI